MHPATLFALALIFPFSHGFAQQAKKEKPIKEVIGWRLDAGQKEAVKDMTMRYSPQGWLIHEHHPQYYCQIDMEYDSLGRMTYREQMCGESFTNGSARFIYSSGKMEEIDDAMGYKRESVTWYNDSGKPNRFTEKKPMYYNEQKDSTFAEYFYDARGLLVREDRKTISFQGVFTDDSVFTASSQTEESVSVSYYYNAADSLTERVVLDRQKGFVNERDVFAYDKIKGLKTQETRYRRGFDKENALTEQSRTEYQYGISGNLLKTSSYYQGVLSNETGYTYQEGLLWQAISRSFGTSGPELGKLVYTTHHIYKNGREIREKGIKADGTQEYVIDFQYMYYE